MTTFSSAENSGSKLVELVDEAHLDAAHARALVVGEPRAVRGR